MNSMESIKNRLQFWFKRLVGRRGNAIVYIAMVLIIFGIIGVVMTSLFTSSIVSTTTPNHSRRALYMTEAGMRYALSELRNAEDWLGRIQDLNATTYTVSAGETFTLDIFGPWYQAGFDQSVSAGGTLTLNVPEGDMPPDYTFDTSSPYLSIVNYNYTGSSIPAQSVAEIDGFTRIDANTVQFNVRNQFIVDDNELVCLAVHPKFDQSDINSGDSLFVDPQARHVFPEFDGAIEINRNVYFYDKWVYDAGPPAQVELTHLTGRPESTFGTDFDVTTSDYVILSPRNHIIVATGTSDTISAGGNLSESINVADRSLHDEGLPPPDINANEFTDNISEIETPVPGYLSVDTGADSLSLGGNYNPPINTAFGAAWYDANKGVGGDIDYCQNGACLFDLGFRAFFILDYTGNGDGLTFSVINGANNDAGSVGGDIEQSELLAYAGDSRTNVAGTAWLDGTGDGLQPPKMAVEFDMLTNFDAAFEGTQPLNYCVAASLKPNTRNDPLSNDRDAVQYVYWGNTSLTIPCRDDNPSYDDNRHDAEGNQPSAKWEFDAGIAVQSAPTFDPTDGTIYFGTNESLTSNFYGVNPDGSLKWGFNPGNSDVTGKPALDTVGGERRVIFAAADGYLYAMWANPPTTSGVQRWGRSLGGIGGRSPAIDANHNIYIGSSNDYFYAYNSSGTQLWAKDLLEDIESSPVVDKTGGPYDGIIYIGRDADGDPTGGKVFSFDATGNYNPNWGGTFNDAFSTAHDVDSKPALSKDGSRIYAVDDDGHVYAINAADGSQAWMRDLNHAVNFVDPVVDTSGGSADGTIYVPTDTGRLYAINPNGTLKFAPWPINFGVAINSSPVVAPDGVIYIGTSDGKVHAINPDGTVKWQFPTGAAVNSSPEIGDDNTVYIGSDDFNLYAISTFAKPRNIKDNLITSILDGGNKKVGGEIVEVDDIDDWLKVYPPKGPWAMRIEVMRSLVANASGNYDYTLHSWVRQCDQLDCSDVTGTFYQDTRIEYEAQTPQLEQTVELSAADHALFDRFLFGFTTATAMGASQNAVIEFFQLSFIRPADPVIAADPDWP